MRNEIRVLRAEAAALYGEAQDAGTATDHGKLLVRLTRAKNIAADALEAEDRAREDRLNGAIGEG